MLYLLNVLNTTSAHALMLIHLLFSFCSVIGIGTLWGQPGPNGPGLVSGSEAEGYTYGGPVAKAVWETEWGCTGTPPVEADGGAGTAGGHWDEECMGNELMTGYTVRCFLCICVDHHPPSPCTYINSIASFLIFVGY